MAIEAQEQTEEVGWRLSNCKEGGSNLALIPTKPQEGRKGKPNFPQPAAARKTSRTGLASLKPTGGFFFFPSSLLS